MIKKDSIKNTIPYVTLDEFDDQSNLEISNQLKIEDILVYLSQFSSRFQIKTFIIISLYAFSVGLHIFTFVYIFLSPKFFSSSNEGNIKLSV